MYEKRYLPENNASHNCNLYIKQIVYNLWISENKKWKVGEHKESEGEEIGDFFFFFFFSSPTLNYRYILLCRPLGFWDLVGVLDTNELLPYSTRAAERASWSCPCHHQLLVWSKIGIVPQNFKKQKSLCKRHVPTLWSQVWFR